MQTPQWVAPPELKTRFDAGDAFETRVFEAMEQTLGPDCFLVEKALTTQQRINETLAAASPGMRVILGAMTRDAGWASGGTVGAMWLGALSVHAKGREWRQRS